MRGKSLKMSIFALFDPPQRGNLSIPNQPPKKLQPPLEVPNHLPATHAAKGPAPPALDGSHVQ